MGICKLDDKSLALFRAIWKCVIVFQKKILRILEESGGIEPRLLVDRLQIKPSDLEREIAALRHMEKIRGELRDGKKIVCLWGD